MVEDSTIDRMYTFVTQTADSIYGHLDVGERHLIAQGLLLGHLTHIRKNRFEARREEVIEVLQRLGAHYND